MRLTHLKLAGFKSFVDPTTIHLHGQRVGVVGPNGCGKSNVMESVRWVLGESSAKEMRAEAMDAVIFNGSSQRKPISRASVELIFDNSMGGASGEWSQYAEISVKRVIERDKGSSYFINNTAVRRRDVADLFLGTGLGGRAYAIIGQNTISRIVEARPEELRVFLEEAAGVSKYKERRRETELRLRDTRENLERVEDICLELNKQLVKLEAQAQVTQHYLALQQSLAVSEAQWWWLRKRDALLAHTTASHDVEQAMHALEAHMAALRHCEAQLEQSRQQHQQSAGQLQDAQSAFYEANAQVSNLSMQVKQSEDARERLINQQKQLSGQRERVLQQQQLTQTSLHEKATGLAAAEALLAEKTAVLQTLTQALPALQAAWQQSQQAAKEAQQGLQRSRQQWQLEQNTLQFLQRALQEASQRLAQSQQALQAWQCPDDSKIVQGQQQLERLHTEHLQQEQQLQELREQEVAQQQALTLARDHQQHTQAQLHRVEAEIQSLQKLQQRLRQDQGLDRWMQQPAMQTASRLWEGVVVPTHWQAALEAFLGHRLNAILPKQAIDLTALMHPEAALAVAIPALAGAAMAPEWQGLPSLYSQLTFSRPETGAVLQQWLHGVYLLEQPAQLARYQSALESGMMLLTPEGDLYQRYSVVYHGQHTPVQGVLERQQQLAALQAELDGLQQAVTAAQAASQDIEGQVSLTRQQQQQFEQLLKQQAASMHMVQLELSRLQLAQENALHQQRMLQQEIAQATEKCDSVSAEIAQATERASLEQQQLAALEDGAEAAQRHQQVAEQAYLQGRDQVQQADKAQQAQQFEHATLSRSVQTLEQQLLQQTQELEHLQQRLAETEQALTVSGMVSLKETLTQALAQQQAAEQTLAQARAQQAEQEMAMQGLERSRLQFEQQLHPLRDALEQCRLKQQACRLQLEQCQQAVQETGFDESVILQGLDVSAPAQHWAQATQRLQQKIQQLGPVNMAAIEEYASEKTRKGYLDSQLEDLRAATATLEEAIHKIDRETRGKLRATFDAANHNFSELFQTLFNGGSAKLELLGDEILDTGVQVFAQPPGKKNTTIQLLSGGEKALTAMALVFALFRLNPAPFCLMDEVDAPLDDSNTERFCQLVRLMSEKTQFLFVSHNKITMEMSQQLIGVTMQESGVSRIVDVDIDEAIRMHAA